MYFAAAICKYPCYAFLNIKVAHGISVVMTFTSMSSFIRPLARTVVNAGYGYQSNEQQEVLILRDSVAPTFTSIACNRFIFALRGVYLELNGGSYHSTDVALNNVKFEANHLSTLSRRGRRRDEVSDAAGDIAVTRHDMSTQDIRSDEYTSGDYDDEDDDVEKSPQSPHPEPSLVVPPRNPNERRMVHLGAPLHAHGMNSSTFLSSEGGSSIQVGRTAGQDSEKENSGVIIYNPRNPSAVSSRVGFGSTSIHGPASIKATSLGRRTPPPSMPFPPEMENNLESPHTPADGTEADQSGKGFGGKFGSTWWRKKQSRRSGNFTYGEVDRGDAFAGSQTRTRSKERHPLDHHYEMDTIHSQALHNSDYEYDEEESPGR
jgi:hypothetical protein